MAAADRGGPDQDLYQLLGVSPDASREEIALAWRRRARDEHPDARPADADAPSRFRALAEAWQVLGDPSRRAAYDRVLGQAPVTRIPVRRIPSPGPEGAVTPPLRAAGPPLRAGPVRVEGGPHLAPRAGSWDEDDIRLALLALRHLARDVRRRPW